MFEKIENEKDAYYLGILLSDGCASISKNKSKSVHLELNKEDSKTVYDFKSYLGVSNNIQKKEKTVAISIGGARLFDNLQKYSCVPRKSLILEFPKNINPNLYCHLIRGYFDGDGCISKILFNRKSRSKTSQEYFQRSKWQVDFSGTFDFLSEIQKIINVNGVLYKVNKNNDKNTFRLIYTHNIKVKKVLEFMYSSATVYMDRKYNKFQEFYYNN